MALPAVLHPIALTQSSDQVVHDLSKEITTAHASHSAGNLIKLELDALVAAVTERKEEAVVAHQELKLDESLTRIDVAVDQVLTEQSDTLLSPDRDEHVLQSHDLVRDNDSDESHHSDSDDPHGFEPCISSFSDPGHYSYSENPSHVAQQPAEQNDTTGRMHGQSDASLSSAEPTRPPLLTANSQLSQQSDRHSSNRLDTAIELAEREYGAVSDLPPPIPPKSPLRDLRHSRPPSVHSTASSSSTLDEHTGSRQRSVRLAAAIGHRQAHTMSDSGHGSDAAGPSRFPARLNSQSTVNLRSKPIRQGGRATWAYSEYPPLDMVLEAQDQEGPIAFPTTSSHAASFISLGQYPSLSPRNPKSSTFGQDLSRYPTGLFDSLSSRSRGVSTYSQASSASHITFAALEHPRTRKISNKLRKGPNGRRKSSLSISTTLASEMAAHTPPISPVVHRQSQSLSFTASPYLPSPLSAHFEPSSPKRRSPSPRSRQRKKSIFSRVFNFHRSKKSSATSRKSEKEYTVEPLQLPPPDQRFSFASIGEEPESEDGGYGAETQEGSEDWRECWWKENMKSQSEDGHAYGYGRGRPSANVLTIHPSPSASALLSTTTTTATSANATKQPTSSSRLASGHGDDTSHSFRGSWYDSMNDRGTFGTWRQQHQAPVNHAFPGGGPRALTSRSPPNLSPNMEDGHGQRELLGLPAHPGHLSSQTWSHMSHTLQPPSPPPALSQPPPRPRHRVLVKRSRSNSIAFQQVPPVVPTPLHRPKMVAQLSSGSETTSSYTSHPSSGVWRGSLASTPSTSPGTSESHSSSACPPARPQSYFAELQMQMRDSGEFDPSSFDSRYPRIVKGSFGGNENGDDSLVASSTSTLKARAQNNASLASLTVMPAHAPTRKLTKRRPQVQKASSTGARTHQRSRSVTFEDAALSAQLPSSPPGIDVKPSSRGRTISREGDTQDEKKRSTSRSKSVLRIKIRSPSCSGRHTAEDDDKGDEKVDYLPPVRPLEPLWIGNGMMLSPYSRYTYPSSTDDFYGKSSSHTPLTDSTTDALTSLAFTGNTGFLSSSALAALSSRLTNNGLYNDDPPRPSTPFLLSKDSEAFTFDPYAEEKENTTTDGKRDNKGTFGKKSKDAMYKSSFSFLRIDSAAAAKSPEVHSVPTQVKQEEDLEGLDDLSALPKPIPRNRPKTKDDSPLRRWTLAMTDVSDEVLVQELEKMRMEARGPTRRKRRGNPKSPTTTSSSGGHTHTDSLSGEGDQKAIVCGGEEDAKWREELVRFRISQAERKPGDESDDESDDSQSESGELEDSPLEFTVMDDAGWKSARRALLCCRELVRTERSYQARLRQLLAGETETPPPALALSYVPALLRASEALLARLEDDPSAWGVSAAFVGVEEEVEAAFVAWCGIVGAVFEGGDASLDRPRKIVRSPKTSSIGRAESGSGAFGKRTTSSASLQQAQPESIYRKRQMSFLEEDPAESGANIGMFTAALGTGLAYNIAPSVSTTHQSTDEFGLKGAEKPLSSSLSISRALKRMTVFSSTSSLPPSPISPSAPPTVSSGSSKKGKKEKKSTVRELAIQPSQRVMRYVLQYRDLLAHTPTESPSRGLVERALESALRIAAKCDRAQGNATFLRNL